MTRQEVVDWLNENDFQVEGGDLVDTGVWSILLMPTYMRVSGWQIKCRVYYEDLKSEYTSYYYPCFGNTPISRLYSDDFEIETNKKKEN